MRRAALALLLSATLAGVARADERRVVVVVDRSASLRHADPEGRGPPLIAQALALAAREGEALGLLATGQRVPAGGLALGRVTREPASLAAALEALLALGPPAPGGADVGAALLAALDAVGPAGRVLLYADDDLDAFAGDRPPREALARARRAAPRPTRDEVNRAARALLLEALGPRRAQVVALRAPLPARARVTPYLEACAGQVIELEGQDGAVTAALAAALRGAPCAAELGAPGARLELAGPARVLLVGSAPFTVADGAALDRERRLWLLDAPAGALPLPPGAERALVSPRPASPPLAAYRLTGGAVRVVALGPLAPGVTLEARGGGGRAALAGAPPAARVPGAEPDGTVAVIARVTLGAGPPLVGAELRVPVAPGEALVRASGPAVAGQPLGLSATAPAGLVGDELALVLREGSGAPLSVTLRRAAKDDATWSGEVVPQAPGPLTLEATGEVALRLTAPIEVAPAERTRLSIEALSDGAGRPLEGTLRLRGGRAELRVRVGIDPHPEGAPPPLELVLLGAPAGARLERAAPVGDALSATLVWPDEAGGAEVTLRVEAPGAVPAARRLSVEVFGWGRLLLGAGLLAVGGGWGALLLRRHRARARARALLGERQLRTIGANGRISPERYLLRDHVQPDGSVVIEPEDTPGGALVLAVREDGTLACDGADGAQLIHPDRPTLLAANARLAPGEPFAMVHGQRALRCVYLEGEPTGDELARRFVDAASYEAELRDSGVFVLLDDDENVPGASARLEASHELLLPPREAAEVAAELPLAPADSTSGEVLSDEGIVIVDSVEGELIDSAALEDEEPPGADDDPADRT